jgi:hypothetical protein
MDVAVVFESMFGNTRAVAEAIADGVRMADPQACVRTLRVAEATPDRLGGAALVVGAPTHMLGLSREASRRKALETAGNGPVGDDVAELGVREWLAGLPASRSGHAAAFDTRVGSRFAGGAARGIAKSLHRHGYAVVTRPEGFVVDGTEGPLRAGERDRAKAWGYGLVRLMAE